MWCEEVARRMFHRFDSMIPDSRYSLSVSSNELEVDIGVSVAIYSIFQDADCRTLGAILIVEKIFDKYQRK